MAKRASKSKKVASKRAKKPAAKALRMATSRGKARVTVIVDPFPGSDPWDWPSRRRT